MSVTMQGPLKVVIGLKIPAIMHPVGTTVARIKLRPDRPAKLFLRRGEELSAWYLEDKGEYCIPSICFGRNIKS